jgi:hypothetical protein
MEGKILFYCLYLNGTFGDTNNKKDWNDSRNSFKKKLEEKITNS